MTVRTFTRQVSTRGEAEIIDVTADILDCVSQAGVHDGTVTAFVPGSTAGLTTIEYESGCVSDLQRFFEEIIPQNREYAHNARWHDGNGHSHARAALLGASLTIPFVEENLTLGTWQQVIYVDFDVRSRNRELVVQMVGE